MEKVIITISLPKIEHYDGPVKQYLLIVVPDELAAKKPAKDYTPEEVLHSVMIFLIDIIETLYINLSNAEATFVQSTRTQRLLKPCHV